MSSSSSLQRVSLIYKEISISCLERLLKVAYTFKAIILSVDGDL